MPPEDVAPTAVPLTRLRACQRAFGGQVRTFNFDGWRVHYRHLGEEGIAFSEPEQEERYRNLSDEERSEFAAKLRSLVDGADLERIRHRRDAQRLQAGMRLALRPTAARTRPAHRLRAPRPRARASRLRPVRRVARTVGSRGDPSPADEPPIAPKRSLLARQRAGFRAWTDAGEGVMPTA
jgi:hypothetical protein